jgi:hypothetical protein
MRYPAWYMCTKESLRVRRNFVHFLNIRPMDGLEPVPVRTKPTLLLVLEVLQRWISVMIICLKDED